MKKILRMFVSSAFFLVLIAPTVYAANVPPDKSPSPATTPSPTPTTGEQHNGPTNDTGMKPAPEIPDPDRDIPGFERGNTGGGGDNGE